MFYRHFAGFVKDLAEVVPDFRHSDSCFERNGSLMDSSLQDELQSRTINYLFPFHRKIADKSQRSVKILSKHFPSFFPFQVFLGFQTFSLKSCTIEKHTIVRHKVLLKENIMLIIKHGMELEHENIKCSNYVRYLKKKVIRLWNCSNI